MEFEKGQIGNPIAVHIHGRKDTRSSTIHARPAHTHFPIRGIPYALIANNDAVLSIQEIGFMGNHLQLVEAKVEDELTLQLDVKNNCIFLVLMLEGFFRYFRDEQLSFYAMGGALYMAYTPRSVLELTVSIGKHSILVIALSNHWLAVHAPVRPYLHQLYQHLLSGEGKLLLLPMCRMSRSMFGKIVHLRLLPTDPLKRTAQLSTTISELTAFYLDNLERGNTIKSQLSPDIANRIVVYIQQHFTDDRKMGMDTIARNIGISEWKLREYAHLLFDKSIHRHVRDLRMTTITHLLESTDLTVAELIPQVGYSNVPYFYQAFFNHYGQTPHAYRKERREKR